MELPYVLLTSDMPLRWVNALSGVAAGVMLLGILMAAWIRLYFNLGRVISTLRYVIVGFAALAGTFFLTMPQEELDVSIQLGRPVTLTQDIMPLVETRCVPCHAVKPSVPLLGPPKGIVLESGDQVKFHASGIYDQVVKLRKMPSGNLTKMSDYERAVVASWFRAGATSN